MFPENKIMVKKDKNKNGEEISVFLSPKGYLLKDFSNYSTIPTKEGGWY